ncbi:hypothetical protein RF11_03061 [Thelohanellus kitauei]|uniref:Integrin alpha-4 n=1 Tax=Thelohanellus kitauei TaxID=669202 RepID=A0A0C2MXF0_THEKT|nr:hypothetical protein RF11_03061 [Thelohanellus kitauei]
MDSNYWIRNRKVISTPSRSNNDLIVTSPTSKWLDLPEVGHVHLFINTKSATPFSSESIIIRGLPIAHSFFGWNADVIDDLDGDGFNDFLIAALKVSEEDLSGGIYVFLGGNDSVIRGLTYYEIIRPRTSVEKEFTGFGFFISEKMVLDPQGNNYVLISRVFSGEVDVFKITPRSPIKVTVDIDPHNFDIDEEKELINPQITIRFKNINGPVDTTIKLSFKHSSNYHSFHQDSALETYVMERKHAELTDQTITVYLRPSNERFSLKWILLAEITVTKSSYATDPNQNNVLFNQIFDREILFEKNCRTKDCTEDYIVTPQRDPLRKIYIQGLGSKH